MPGPPGRARRPGLPVLAQQPHRRRRQPREPPGLGRAWAREQRRGADLRRRLRRRSSRIPDLPHSIYEIDGREARCAIEMRSFSEARRLHRRALRLHRGAEGTDRQHPRAASASLFNGLWARRHATKFNSVPYIIQKRVRRRCTRPKGRKQTAEQVAYYMENARSAARAVWVARASRCFGGEHAPYIWVRDAGRARASWDTFDKPARTTPTWCAPRAAASGRPARATSGSRRSIRARTWRPPSSASAEPSRPERHRTRGRLFLRRGALRGPVALPLPHLLSLPQLPRDHGVRLRRLVHGRGQRLRLDRRGGPGLRLVFPCGAAFLLRLRDPAHVSRRAATR